MGEGNMTYLQKQQRRRYGKEKTTHTNYALYYHLSWAVEEGLPLITKEVEEALKKFLVKKCKALEIILIAVEMAENHVHMILSLKPTHYIPDVVQTLKGSSSHFINNHTNMDFALYWERGYSIRTISEINLDNAKYYVLNQKKHHGIEGKTSSSKAGLKSALETP
jgi:REP element-mobilizing transposase RayT